MHVFWLWLSLALVSFGSLGWGYNQYLIQHPHKVFVAVDACAAMEPVWSQAQAQLATLSPKRYHAFALATEKDLIHGWASMLALDNTTPRGERDLARLHATQAFIGDDSAKRYVISNAPAAELERFSGWHIIQLSADR